MEEPGVLGRATPALFFVATVVWAGVTATSSQPVLVLPALVCAITAVSFFITRAKSLRRPLGAASSLLGLVISLFQVYLGIMLVGTQLATLALYSLAVFAGIVVLQVVLLYATLKTSQA